MTDKRKKLIRSIAEKTGVSYAGAANLLDKDKPHFNRKPFTIESLFANDRIEGMFVKRPESVGGFVRGNSDLAIYNKQPDEWVFVIGEEGENILAIQKPRRVIVPMFAFSTDVEIDGVVQHATPEAHARAVSRGTCDRMLALFDAAFCSGFPSEPPIVEPSQVETHLQKHFGRPGTIHVLTLDPFELYQERFFDGKLVEPGVVCDPKTSETRVLGILDYAGIKVTAGSNGIGIALFTSRVAPIRVRRPSPVGVSPRMTDKRKQRARKLMAETGLSYKAALNRLDREAAARKASQGETPSQTETPKLDNPKSGNETSGT